MLESIPDPVIGCDVGGVVLYWNRAARELYGFSSAEAVGQPVLRLMRTRFPAPLAEILEEFADVGHWEGEVVHRLPDGRELTVETRWTARYDDAGRLLGGIGIERPVPGPARSVPVAPAERAERQEEDLHRAERLDSFGQLARGIVHDFNNALGIIINYAAFVTAELRRAHAQTDEERWLNLQDDMGEIQRAAERAAELTHELGVFARQEPAELQPLGLNDVITGMQSLLRRSLGDHIRLELALDPGLPPVWADPSQLRQLLVNLAANARTAMPQGGSVKIETARTELDASAVEGRVGLSPGPHVRLRFADSGIGMSAEVRDQAFDPFFTTRAVGEGMGLGLSNAQRIVARMNGHAELFSEPAVGTTFVALIPVGSHDEPAPADGATPFEAPSDGETVLLVEDEGALLEAARRILAGAGYQVIAAPDGPAALELAAHSGPIDLILTDVVMPGMLGPELVAELRGPQPAVRVLYMSGYADVAGSEETIDRGTLIEKPFTAPELLARVRGALGTRRSQI